MNNSDPDASTLSTSSCLTDDSSPATGQIEIVPFQDGTDSTDATPAGISEETIEQAASLDSSRASSSKKVVFPDDDQLITGYLEPPNPWKQGDKYNFKEAYSCYLSACEKLGIKPSQKLLDQLKNLQLADATELSISLQGEKLDIHHCDALEEIFKRLQFQIVDLGGTNLDDDASTAIFEIIEYYESAEKLILANNHNIKGQGWRACGRMVKMMSQFKSLDMRHCTVPDASMALLARNLRLAPSLATLNLENCNMNARMLMLLVAGLKTNAVLQKLYLGDNKLQPTDGIHVGALLKNNKTINTLDLRNNKLGDVGLSHVCSGLSEHIDEMGLKCLVLTNNLISYAGMAFLAKALIHNRSLVQLNLSKNPLTNEGVFQLKDSLIRNQTIEQLEMQDIKLTDEGIIALAEFLAESGALMRLDIRDNDLRIGGLMALSLSMKLNQTLIRLDLNKEPKKEVNIRGLADQWSTLHQRIYEYCSRNKELRASQDHAMPRDISTQSVGTSEMASQQNVVLHPPDATALLGLSLLSLKSPPVSPLLSPLDEPPLTPTTIGRFSIVSHPVSTPRPLAPLPAVSLTDAPTLDIPSPVRLVPNPAAEEELSRLVEVRAILDQIVEDVVDQMADKGECERATVRQPATGVADSDEEDSCSATSPAVDVDGIELHLDPMHQVKVHHQNGSVPFQ